MIDTSWQLAAVECRMDRVERRILASICIRNRRVAGTASCIQGLISSFRLSEAVPLDSADTPDPDGEEGTHRYYREQGVC